MGVDGAVGHVVEFAGPAIEALSMEGRMTICNMTIEGGGRAGMIAPDETTFAWLEERGVEIDPAWRDLHTDDGATFDREIVVDASALSPQVTWGTTPGDGRRRHRRGARARRTPGDERALEYMALEPGTPMTDITLDRVFIGSCTNSRIGDLRAAASMIGGRKVADGVIAMVVPGSQQVKAQAEAEGLARGLPRRRASTGARRAARCAWA